MTTEESGHSEAKELGLGLTVEGDITVVGDRVEN